MDIDISDPAFYLGTNQGVSNMDVSNDNTMFLYIGVAIVVAFIGMFVYKFYMNKQSNCEEQPTMDCPGGFCIRPNNNNQTE